MKRRDLMKNLLIAGGAVAINPRLATAAGSSVGSAALKGAAGSPVGDTPKPGSPAAILLNDYLPRSIYKIPITKVKKAKFPCIDCHCHGHGSLTVSQMLRMMDAVGIEKAVLYTQAGTPHLFSEVVKQYAGHLDRFDPWCILDLRDFGKENFESHVLKSLKMCHSAGAKGIGELVDKGWGLSTKVSAKEVLGGGYHWSGDLDGGPTYTHPPGPPELNHPMGPHVDDKRLDPIWDEASRLGMPVGIHVADPMWSFEPMDNRNDGLMNGWSWRIVVEGERLSHDQLVTSLTNTVRKHPRTQFIACHLANLCTDLERLGRMFDNYPNLHADIAARFAETATIPRVMRRFLIKYSDRVVYGTDVQYNEPFFHTTFRILESDDDHFYRRGQVESANFNFNYHWTLNGFGLPDDVLKKIYHENAEAIFARAAKQGSAS